jgi:hypothetical protein
MNGGDVVPAGWKIPNRMLIPGIGFLVVLLCVLGLSSTHRATVGLSRQVSRLEARLQSGPSTEGEVGKLSEQLVKLKSMVEAIPRQDPSVAELIAQFKQVEAALANVEAPPSLKPDSQVAVKLGQEAIRKGNLQMGELYLINAVTNAPRDVELLTNYTDTLVGRNDAVPATSLERLTSLLELASYQVDPASIPAVVSLLEKARARLAEVQKQAAEAEVSSEAKDTEPLAERWKALAAVETSDFWNDSAQLEAHLRALQSLIDELAVSNDPANAKLQETVQAQLARWAETAQALRLSKYVDSCLAKLDGKQVAIGSEAAVSIVQAAENSLPGFWGVDLSKLPESLRTKVVGYPDAVKQKVNTIADARSAPILAEIRNLVSSANDQAISALAKHPQKSPFPGKEMEKVCNSSQQLIKAAQQKAIRITSEAAVTQAQAEIEKLTDTLSKLRQEQYRRYQVAVIDKCDAAFRAYNEYWTVDKAEARKEFMKQGFATVDQSVLSPEVGRLFNDVLNKLMPRMKPEDLVKSEEEMSKVEGKIKLEDF